MNESKNTQQNQDFNTPADESKKKSWASIIDLPKTDQTKYMHNNCIPGVTYVIHPKLSSQGFKEINQSWGKLYLHEVGCHVRTSDGQVEYVKLSMMSPTPKLEPLEPGMYAISKTACKVNTKAQYGAKLELSPKIEDLVHISKDTL